MKNSNILIRSECINIKLVYLVFLFSCTALSPSSYLYAETSSPLRDKHQDYDKNKITNKQEMIKASRDWKDAFLGLTIGGKSSSIFDLKNEVVVRNSDGAIKLIQLRVDKNRTLSVTYHSIQDRILYLELNWNWDAKGKIKGKGKGMGNRPVGIRDFEFRKTLLNDIRNELKSNGFTYSRRILEEISEGVVTFNAFELKDTPAIYVVFVTLLTHQAQEEIAKLPEEKQVLGSLGGYFKLDGVIVADETYLDVIWGKEKNYNQRVNQLV